MVTIKILNREEYIEAESRLPSPEVVVDRTAARRLFLFRSLVVLPEVRARERAAAERVAELGGRRAQSMVFAASAPDPSIKNPTAEQFLTWKQSVLQRYAAAKAPYERQERDERRSMEFRGAAILREFLGRNPRASKEAQLRHMEEAAHVLHAQDREVIS